ncbi:MAG: RIP metalloprotease RseP [Roseibacillus sp.]|nr:RIP metalloprotease RseP [Roseibacillus sp.]
MTVLLNILIVVALFNVIIFVHELGHFLAAKWRGLRIDRFQIWFGKPLWKKEINGVQYGLGWLPAGGFVALPQMAPMEAVEGKNRDPGDPDTTETPLPPVKPLDKIIVAFAGPLFSFLLALLSALVVMGVGKPKDTVESTVIGYVAEDGVAHGKLQVGDEILAVNGTRAKGFLGSPSFDSVRESIMLSEGDQIEFLVQRDGQEVAVTTQFNIPKTQWWERKGMRTVGIWVENRIVINFISESGPADRAGLQAGDEIVSANGEALRSRQRFSEIVENAENEALPLLIRRNGEEKEMSITPRKPTNVDPAKAMIGVGFETGDEFTKTIYNPGPLEQVGDSVRMMWVTLAKIVSPKSDVGIQHLSGPVGIGGVMFDMLSIEDGWRRLLWFMVLFNVNLAILNMLPLPILDGGHIVLAIGEILAGRPIQARLLEVVQFAFFFLLLGLFLFITTKDIGDRFGSGGGGGPAKYEWPENSS